jgi:hypothetical protein
MMSSVVYVCGMSAALKPLSEPLIPLMSVGKLAFWPICVGLVWIGAISACSNPRGKESQNPPAGGSAKVSPVPKPTFTLFALAEVRGQLGPCGCTSDPLGDLARTAQVIHDARAKGPVLVVDAGSLLYSKPSIEPANAQQEEAKADLLASAYKDTLKVDAVGIGPLDVVAGPGQVRLSRQFANAAPKAGVAIASPMVIDVGGTKVGVFGVADPDAIGPAFATDPVAAGKAAVAKLQADGAKVVVGLVTTVSKKRAVQIAKQIGNINFVVGAIGVEAPEPDHVPARTEEIAPGMFLLLPANRGQIVSRVDITVRSNGGFTDAVGPGAARDATAVLAKQMESLDKELVEFAKDPSADAGFVSAKKKEREELAAKKASFAASPWQIPATGNFFGFEQVRISKALACNAAIQTATDGYNQSMGLANVAFAKTQTPLKIPKGAATYVGTEACSDCHQEAVDFWQTTRHAGAWKTLEVRNQQFDLDCIGCHVTGWGKPSGATVAVNENLRDVQCEVCHAPGSIHVAKGGEDKPRTVMRAPTADLCATQCHTKEHSDTFEYTAYLRDILGKGHGEAERKALGEGATGHQLRTAALEKAGKLLGAGCTK